MKDVSDITVALALLAARGVGERTLSRWLAWATARERPVAAWLGRPREELGGAFPDKMDSVIRGIASVDEDALGRASKWVDRVHAAGGQFLLVTQADYPRSLIAAFGPGAPPVLTVLGDSGLLECESLGIVGTRRPSEAGAELARYAARWAVERKRPIVSGGAQGTDTAAHLATLENGGVTVVVSPQGALTFPMSTGVASAIDDGRAVVVSQFLPDSPWTTGGAIARNETIAGLSWMVCVIEPRSPGGSMKTGRDALAQGKPVLVYSGVGSRGKELVREGARGLLGPAKRFSHDYLDNVWLETLQARPEQIDLL